jgi:hypothetical protein
MIDTDASVPRIPHWPHTMTVIVIAVSQFHNLAAVDQEILEHHTPVQLVQECTDYICAFQSTDAKHKDYPSAAQLHATLRTALDATPLLPGSA